MDYSDPTTWASLAEIDPEYKKFLETAPAGPPPASDPAQIPHMRPIMKQMSLNSPAQQIDRTSVKQEDITIPARDGYNIPAVVFKPSSGASGPLAVLFHGGGFLVGFPEMEGPAAVALVQNHNATVVSVDYRMAPEHVFPKAIEDSWDALKWVAVNAHTFGADPSKGFLLGGSSAGGNIAAVCSHLARDEKLSPPLTGIWLNYPVTVGPDAVPGHLQKDYQSNEQNATAPGIISKASLEMGRAIYKPDQTSDLFSPLIWSTGHRGLPKTWLHACGLDPLRDDALLYERELRQAGVETHLEVYPGMPHGFDAMNSDLKQAAKHREDRAKAFAWILSGGK
ncbi:Putative alpha/beta hydrolase-3 [Septoria linicola]|uniref:Alpha/beta hydrolase-3 n=1 Tax=Septoria linicola TaxID=215465 RepID=A0A9Q9B806_9PEZI|nr:Putative alpha/beta hydrolase-3 [Septoria linicola]